MSDKIRSIELPNGSPADAYSLAGYGAVYDQGTVDAHNKMRERVHVDVTRTRPYRKPRANSSLVEHETGGTVCDAADAVTASEIIDALNEREPHEVIYIQFSDDGTAIRKWQRSPFEGGRKCRVAMTVTTDGEFLVARLQSGGGASLAPGALVRAPASNRHCCGTASGEKHSPKCPTIFGDTFSYEWDDSGDRIGGVEFPDGSPMDAQGMAPEGPKPKGSGA